MVNIIGWVLAVPLLVQFVRWRGGLVSSRAFGLQFLAVLAVGLSVQAVAAGVGAMS